MEGHKLYALTQESVDLSEKSFSAQFINQFTIVVEVIYQNFVLDFKGKEEGIRWYLFHEKVVIHDIADNDGFG